jgi:hypothetical protein
VKRKCWVKNWIRRCDWQGAYTQLIRELQLEDAQITAASGSTGGGKSSNSYVSEVLESVAILNRPHN